jgi:hypothetical protein
MIDAKDVRIFWNTEIGDALRANGCSPDRWIGPSRVTDLVVTEITRASEDADWWDYSARYDCSDGNCWSGWTTDDGHGPEVVFRGLLVTGFKSPDHLIAAIGEFARIRQCEWARRMLEPHVACKLGIV